jgi:hypothetical protein
LVDLFEISPVDPLPRTSFFTETLEELGIVSDLGDVPVLSGFGVYRLNLADTVSDPQIDVWDQLAPRVDIAFPAPRRRDVPVESLLALVVRIETDITDPALCEGRKIGLVAVIDNPSWGDAYTANPSYPGEYFAGGNFFPFFSQIDCELVTGADTYLNHEVLRDLANPGTALLTVDEGVTNAVVLFPGETIDPDGQLRFVVFEQTDGESYTPENTRNQLWPDLGDPAISIADAVQVFSSDFTLVPSGALLSDDPVTIEVPIDDGTVTYEGPIAVEPDGSLFFDLTVTHSSGEPLAGVEWLATLGEPPSSPDAVNSAGLLDESGHVRFGFPAPSNIGETSLYTSDGSTVWFVTTIDVGPIETDPEPVSTATPTIVLDPPEPVSTATPTINLDPPEPVSTATPTINLDPPEPVSTATPTINLDPPSADDGGFPIGPMVLVAGFGTIGVGIWLVRKNPRPPGDAPSEIDVSAASQWSNAELDEWFERDFGGDHAFHDFYIRGDGYRVSAEDHPDLHFGMTAYRQLQYDTELEEDGEAQPWPLLSHEAKTRFRRGWENTQATTDAVTDELAPYPAMDTLVDARHELAPSKSRLPRWIRRRRF